MANVFEEVIPDLNKPGMIPFYSSYFKEVKCQQGIADFIIPIGPKLEESKIKEFKNLVNNLPPSSIQIVSFLNHLNPISKEYIIQNSGFTKQTIIKALSNLEKDGLVKLNDSGMYMLTTEWPTSELNLWAFELKLHNWKRALFQALQSKAYASSVTVVFPSEKEDLILEKLEIFASLKVGVLILDVKNKKIRNLIQPAPNAPTSKSHFLYTFTQLIKMA